MNRTVLGLAMALACVAPTQSGAQAHAATRASLALVQLAAHNTQQETPLTGKHEDDCAEALAMIHYACGSGDPWACLGAHLGSLAGGCGWQ